MKFLSIFRSLKPSANADGGKMVSSPEELAKAIREGQVGSIAGVAVTPDTALSVGAVFACVRILSGAVANMPLHIKRRVDAGVREELTDHPVSKLLRRKPNGWQTPAMFRRMMQAHVLLRGNAYAQIVWSRGRPIGLNPLHPDRMKVVQNNDLSLTYTYTTKSGGKTTFEQSEIFHLVGLSLDGITGVSVIKFAKETIGLSIAQDRHGANTFKNAARPSLALRHKDQLGKEGMAFLRESLDAYRMGGANEGKALILEEGMELEKISLTPEDVQWIESRKVSRTDIAMYFGVPPHLIGDTEKSTSWGSGIEHQNTGFVTYGLEDHITMWEQTADRDLITEDDVYTRFNRKSLIRGDLKARTEFYRMMMGFGAYSPNDVRALEDENPRDGGDIYYPPPNMTKDFDTLDKKGSEE